MTVFGKGGKERSIPLNKACLQAIDDYMKIVKRYIKEAGLDPQRYSTHKLRHTAATLMYKYGNVDIRALQEILGHESISTTEIYTHLDQQQLKEAVNKHPLSDFSVK